MSSETSDIQRKIFDFIVNYIRDEGMPPTNREIGKAMQIASTGHVDYHLSMLEKKSLITRESKKSRGIKLVQQPWGIPIKGQIAAGEPIEASTDPGQLLDVGRGRAKEHNPIFAHVDVLVRRERHVAQARPSGWLWRRRQCST